MDLDVQLLKDFFSAVGDLFHSSNQVYRSLRSSLSTKLSMRSDLRVGRRSVPVR